MHTTTVNWRQAPPLPNGGTLHFDAATRLAAASDLGQIAQAVPGAILRPGGPGDIAAMVRWCAEQGVPVRARGCEHTDGGQGLPPAGGLQVDMTTMAALHSVRPGVADVAAGATIRDVVEAAWQIGYRLTSGPTGYLKLTLGGVLSVGGWSSVWREGAITDRCVGLEIVTATGDIVWCSREERPELFRAALGGLGMAGIITRAQLALCMVPTMVRTWTINYSNVHHAIADMRTLADRGDVVEMMIQVRHPDIHTYQLVASTYYDRQSPKPGRVLRGMPAPEQTLDRLYWDHTTEVDQLYATAFENGWRATEKPWSDLIIPGRSIDAYVAATIPEIGPRDLSPTSIGLWFPHRSDAFGTDTALRLPTPGGGDGMHWLVDILSDSTGIPTHDVPDWRTRALHRNRGWYDRAVSMGGTIYPIGATPLTTEEWREHIGPQADLDPHGVFQPWASAPALQWQHGLDVR
ncbi:FAD-binding protein [Saccharopolyspora shandongensis]|uniref:FAD-binding protein n=1 Tax=Saccharopolyspora shandongensis TaxID=418495 RepID=UPI0033F5007B